MRWRPIPLPLRRHLYHRNELGFVTTKCGTQSFSSKPALSDQSVISSNDRSLPETVAVSTPPAIPIDLRVAAKIEGEESHIATVQLSPGEVLRAESGAMLYMTHGVVMETSLQGASSAFQRMLTGQNVFLTDFKYEGQSSGTVCLGTDFPSKILRLRLDDYSNSTLICQRGAYLASNPTVDIQMEATKSLTAGFFGGQGFILQKLTGHGDVLVKGGGTVVNKTLSEGETLRVTSGSIVAFESSISYDVQMMPGIKNAMFGGEGLFVATLQGPGQIWLQGMPPDRMIAEIARRMPGPGIGLGIPIGMGAGGGGPGDVATDEGAAGSDGGEGSPEVSQSATATDAAIDADRQATVASSGMMGDTGGAAVDSESPSALFGDAAPKDDETGRASSTLDQDDSTFATETTDPSFSDDNSFSSNETSFDDGNDFASDFEKDVFQDGELFNDTSSGSDSAVGEEASGGGILSSLWDFFTSDDD